MPAEWECIYDDVDREARQDWLEEYGHMTPRQRMAEEMGVVAEDLIFDDTDEVHEQRWAARMADTPNDAHIPAEEVGP